MKKSALFIALSGLFLAGCGNNNPSTTSQEATSQGGQTTSQQTTTSTYQDTSVPEISQDSDSGVGEKTNDEPYEYDAIKVNKPSKTLAEDFAFGADLSIVAEVEKYGGVYYNEEGKEQDVFKLLAADGVNYCRLRLWNDPKSASGEPYGGGNNDLETDIALAKRAKAAGMKVMVDFHYSDSWADPAKFHCPKAWADELSADKPDLIGEFTRDSLRAFKAAGIHVDSVQIGNESNYGIAGEKFLGGPGTIVAMVRAGVAAAKEVFPDITTLVHLTNIKSPKGVYNFLDAMKNGLDDPAKAEPVPYDMVGLSYYPFWHGTQENLLNVMNHIHDTYGKPSMVVETSYGFTDEQHEYCSNTYHSSTFETPGGYITGWQGQATELSDVVSTVSEVKESYGRGVFWWEPAWLPVDGSTWATATGQFYNEHGRDPKANESVEGLGGPSAWSNQGWFSYTGKALPSASTYKHIVKGDKTATEEVIGIRTPEIDVNVNLINSKVNLPSTALVVTSLDALRHRNVVWTQSEIQNILDTGDGQYDVHGLVDGLYEIVAHVTAETNYVHDYSFEEQATGEQVPVGGDYWNLECSIDGAARIEAKSEGNLDGEKYFHWYNTADFYFTLSQTLTGVRAGTYDLSTYIMAGDLVSDYSKLDLWYQIGDGEKVVVDILSSAVKGWGAPLNRYMTRQAIQNIEIPEVAGGVNVTIGLTAEVGGTGWGHCDLWSFAKHKEVAPVEDYCADGALEDGDFAKQTLWTAPTDPWISESQCNQFWIDNTQQMKKDADNTLHWYDAQDYSWSLKQNIKNLDAGEYTFSFHMVSDAAANFNSFVFFYQVEGEDRVEVSLAQFLVGWQADDACVDVTATAVAKEGKKLTVGLEVNGKAGSWGHIADLALTKNA